jgi:integrating conjugative element protein (TIGR03752 family)
MSTLAGNRLVPLLGALMLLVLVAALVRTCGSGEPDRPGLGGVPDTPAPDADSPADTVRTLTAEVAGMRGQLDALTRHNDQLQRENGELRGERKRLAGEVTDDVLARVDRKIARAGEAGAGTATRAVDALTRRVDRLSRAVKEFTPGRRRDDIPVGLGYDQAAAVQETVWITPLDQVPVDGAGADRTGLLHSGTAVHRAPSDAVAGQHPSPERTRKKAEEPVPFYTVPRNSTLIGTTAFTALVGRIPVGGKVQDPMPFKVLVGAKNLAANGWAVPRVRGMVFAGTAVGDWTLSCVTGTVDSVTFVFDDGTVRTLSADEKGRGADRDLPGASSRELGWISDARGIPCVSGERITNAGTLAQRAGIMALGAAGEAAASAQTTSLVNSTGGITSALTGELGQYVLGKTVSGGAEEVSRWLAERQAQSFDAVFVRPGARVAVHVDRERLDSARAVLAARGPGRGEQGLDGWTRTAEDEIAARFPRLPNPTLVLYVYPHLTAEGHPVPGYATSFPLYEGVEYALPGEAEAGL